MLALMLVDGGLSFAASHDAPRMKESRVLAMKKRIQLVPSPELDDARPRRQAIVEITTRDGRVLAHRTYAVKGTADNPMTGAEVQEKALDLLAPILGMRRAQSLIASIGKLDRVEDMRTLRPLVRVAPAKRRMADRRHTPSVSGRSVR
jgi:2-methylcitrate dehydratase PrpD